MRRAIGFFFFFSSRRRHTRCSRDWSSDVCSSDLGRGEKKWGRGARTAAPPPRVSPQDQAETFGQVLSIQVYVEVGSPLGQPGGAVMLRMGMVIMRFGSRIWNSYSLEFMLKPVTASL